MDKKDTARALDAVLSRIEQAAKRAGRSRSDITLIAVSKGVGREAIEAAARSGVTVFGENRVQEAISKFEKWGRCDITVHLIGPLQTNKIKKAVGFFDLIHSIDSVHLAKKVSEEAERKGIAQSVLVQVNIGEEATKHGVSIKEAPALIDTVRGLSHLRLLGLMAIAPQHAHPEAARPYFARLRELGSALGLNRFSMGMSADFEVAIEEGATWVRIGTALFGKRLPPLMMKQ